MFAIGVPVKLIAAIMPKTSIRAYARIVSKASPIPERFIINNLGIRAYVKMDTAQ
jgi:hypothetical protein